MTERGTYRVKVRVTAEREVLVEADGLDEAEIKGLVEVVALTGGYDAEVLWVMQSGENIDDDD
jgi:hypothetical protein